MGLTGNILEFQMMGHTQFPSISFMFLSAHLYFHYIYLIRICLTKFQFECFKDQFMHFMLEGIV